MDREVIEWANDPAPRSWSASMALPPSTIAVGNRLWRSNGAQSAQEHRPVDGLLCGPDSARARGRHLPRALGCRAPVFYDLGFNEIYLQAIFGREGYQGQGDWRALRLWYQALLLAGTVVSVHPFEDILRRLNARGASVGNWYPCGPGSPHSGSIPGRTRSLSPLPGRADLPDWQHRVGNSGARPAATLFSRVDEREPCRTCWARHLSAGSATIEPC